MYLTDEKVAVMGAGGAIGSNLAQTLLTSGTTSQVAMYDPFAPRKSIIAASPMPM